MTLRARKKSVYFKKKSTTKIYMLSKPTQVRFSEHVDRRLGEIAEANGMTKAELTRICVTRFLDEVERTGKIEVKQEVRNSHQKKRSQKSA